ncbi:hypothetical protein F4808DRAFT_344909 [Astrocystis sublimbata]|nr:hypothetical protein F4808DRAFT_344909 [Astrocystis sublimbata]
MRIPADNYKVSVSHAQRRGSALLLLDAALETSEASLPIKHSNVALSYKLTAHLATTSDYEVGAYGRVSSMQSSRVCDIGGNKWPSTGDGVSFNGRVDQQSSNLNWAGLVQDDEVAMTNMRGHRRFCATGIMIGLFLSLRGCSTAVRVCPSLD